MIDRRYAEDEARIESTARTSESESERNSDRSGLRARGCDPRRSRGEDHPGADGASPSGKITTTWASTPPWTGSRSRRAENIRTLLLRRRLARAPLASAGWSPAGVYVVMFAIFLASLAGSVLGMVDAAFWDEIAEQASERTSTTASPRGSPTALTRLERSWQSTFRPGGRRSASASTFRGACGCGSRRGLGYRPSSSH